MAWNDLKCIFRPWFSLLSTDTPPPLTLRCKNEKQPFGPIELDLEAGNLVTHYISFPNIYIAKFQWKMDSKLTQYLNSEMSEIVDWENIEALLSLPEVDPN